MNKTNNKLTTTNNTSPLLPGIQNLLSASKRVDGKTGAVKEMAKPAANVAVQMTTTKEGGKILTVVQAPSPSDKNERDRIIQGLNKEKVPRALISAATGVSESTVHNALKKRKGGAKIQIG